MELERSSWLQAGCGISLCIHLVVGLNFRSFGHIQVRDLTPTEIEVVLEEMPDPKDPEKPKPKRRRRSRTRTVRDRYREVVAQLRERRTREIPVRTARAERPRRERVVREPVRMARNTMTPREIPPVTPLPEERPAADRSPRLRAALPSFRVSRADLPKFEAPPEPERRRETAPEMPREQALTGDRPESAPRLTTARQRAVLAGDNPIAGLGPREETPTLTARPAAGTDGAPVLRRASLRTEALPGSSSSDEPGSGGRRGADEPAADAKFEGGQDRTAANDGPRRGAGAGLVGGGNPLAGVGPKDESPSLAGGSGESAAERERRRRLAQRNRRGLPGDQAAGPGSGSDTKGDGAGAQPENGPGDFKFAGTEGTPGAKGPRLGGRAGLTVENLIAKEAPSDDAPGLSGGGGGSSRELGLGRGRARGGASGPSEASGGGGSGGIRGADADLPPTGQSGLGDGTGTGSGGGGGRSARGRLDLGGGNPLGGGSGGNGRGLSGGRLTLETGGRGIPLGGGDGTPDGDGRPGSGSRTIPGGGPLGSGRGGGVSAPADRVESPKNAVHIVYVVDCSPSATWKTKMLKAKKALRKALAELEAADTFTILDFANNVRSLGSPMKPTPENIQRAFDYLDSLQARGNYTDLSAALGEAFSIQPLTHIFLLSDGQPTGGISDPDRLREWAKRNNTQNAQILTVALEQGSKAYGLPLLRGLSEDSNGVFSSLERRR